MRIRLRACARNSLRILQSRNFTAPPSRHIGETPRGIGDNAGPRQFPNQLTRNTPPAISKTRTARHRQSRLTWTYGASLGGKWVGALKTRPFKFRGAIRHRSREISRRYSNSAPASLSSASAFSIPPHHPPTPRSPTSQAREELAMVSALRAIGHRREIMQRCAFQVWLTVQYPVTYQPSG